MSLLSRVGWRRCDVGGCTSSRPPPWVSGSGTPAECWVLWRDAGKHGSLPSDSTTELDSEETWGGRGGGGVDIQVGGGGGGSPIAMPGDKHEKGGGDRE